MSPGAFAALRNKAHCLHFPRMPRPVTLIDGVAAEPPIASKTFTSEVIATRRPAGNDRDHHS
jgi:hypothetical protein